VFFFGRFSACESTENAQSFSEALLQTWWILRKARQKSSKTRKAPQSCGAFFVSAFAISLSV